MIMPIMPNAAMLENVMAQLHVSLAAARGDHLPRQ